jgi:hypothetical protein
MVFVFPLAIWIGILTFISFIITLFLGLSVYKFNKPWIKVHLTFAGITFVLAIIHVIFVVLLFYFGYVI